MKATLLQTFKTLPESCLTYWINQPSNLPGAITARLGKVGEHAGSEAAACVERDTVGECSVGLWHSCKSHSGASLCQLQSKESGTLCIIVSDCKT